MIFTKKLVVLKTAAKEKVNNFASLLNAKDMYYLINDYWYGYFLSFLLAKQLCVTGMTCNIN